MIIEFPPQYGHSKIQFELLQKIAQLRIDLNVFLDLAENGFGDLSDLSPLFSQRRLYVLYPANS